MTGFKERAVLSFRKRYLALGLSGIEHKLKGKPKALLSKVQREEIVQWFMETTPEAHGYEARY